MSSDFGTLLFLVLLGSIAAWFWFVHLLSKRLRTVHPDVYESLGRPTALSHNTTVTRKLVMRFLFSGRHRSLSDERLRQLGNLTVGTLYFTAVAGIAVIAMAVIWPPAAA